MTHNHIVCDTDKHFKIIPQTRKIVNASGKKKLMRLDHKSERFTFELPRYIEGHDMSLCNVLEVHFNNISEDGKEQKPNMDELTDIQISPDDDSVVIFSWLITENCTQLAGILSFFFRFSCVNDEGTVDYNWHTDSYDGITVGDVEYNSQIVIDFYADIIHTWKAEIVADAVAGSAEAQAKAEEAQRKAEQAQTGAEQHSSNAKTAETNAVNAQNAATEAARQAELSRQGAAQAEQNSKTSETNAAASAEEAKKSEAEAKKAAENAKTSETNAAGSENAAKLSEANAKQSETNAKQSETNAGKHMSRASGYETSAYTYARNAGDSAKNAATSEANAKISEQNAEVFAESAAESAKRLGDAVVLAEIPHPDPENIGKAIIVNEDGTGFVFGESGSGEAIDTGALFGLTEKQTEMLPETGVSFSAGSRQKLYTNTPDDVQFPLEELYLGDYLVYWRGVPYKCAVQSAKSESYRIITLGNVFGISHHTTFTGIDMTVDSGEPFLIEATFIEYPQGKVSQITIYRFDDQETEETIPVQIFLCEKEPNKMPTSYLPDGVPCHIDGMGAILSDYTIATEEDMTGIPRLNLVTGNTYIVKIKGVAEYTCVAFASELEGIPIVGIGNAMPFGGEDTGEPFLIAEVPPEVAAQMGANVAIIPLTDELPDPLIFSIWGDIKEVRKLHADCLPDDATVFYLTSPNGTKFAITVDDSGTITATEVT